MAKAKWGIKRICVSCTAKFYDMTRSPIVCPSCNTEQNMQVIYGGSRRDIEEENAPAVTSVDPNAKGGDNLNLDVSLNDDDVVKDDTDDSTLIVEDDDLGDDSLPDIELPDSEREDES